LRKLQNKILSRISPSLSLKTICQNKLFRIRLNRKRKKNLWILPKLKKRINHLNKKIKHRMKMTYKKSKMQIKTIKNLINLSQMRMGSQLKKSL
jgi:hypothetical protein